MNVEEIIKQAKLHFGKNRKLLKERLLNFNFDGSEYRIWRRHLKQLTSQPFAVNYGMFGEVTESLKSRNYDEIDWNWLGDISWEFKFLLNENVEKGLDWDKKLALNCGGTARILQIYVSDIVPCFVIDTYYMTYSKSENFYEFGPIVKLIAKERKFVDKVKEFFQTAGFTFLDEEIAVKKYKELHSDCNEGNASLYDVLFSDTDAYQTEIKRFNAKELNDPTGKKINWNEYYDEKRNLKKREEYRYFSSKNIECVITDNLGQIIKVKIWRGIDKRKHQEFVLDILKENEKLKRKKLPAKRS